MSLDDKKKILPVNIPEEDEPACSPEFGNQGCVLPGEPGEEA